MAATALLAGSLCLCAARDDTIEYACSAFTKGTSSSEESAVSLAGPRSIAIA